MPEWASRQDPIGERFIARDGKLVIDRRPAPSDIEAAQDAAVQRQHAQAQAAAERLRGVVARRGNALTMIWADLAPTVERYTASIAGESSALPSRLADMYQASVELASLVDQDDGLRELPEDGEKTLPADIRRLLLAAVTAAALLSRSFPSNLKRDTELVEFLRPDEAMSAKSILRQACENEVLTPEDATTLNHISATGEHSGPQGQKSRGRVVVSTTNLLLTGAGVAGLIALTAVGGAPGAVVAALVGGAWVNHSQTWRHIGKWMSELADTDLSILRRIPIDLAVAVREAVLRARGNSAPLTVTHFSVHGWPRPTALVPAHLEDLRKAASDVIRAKVGQVTKKMRMMENEFKKTRDLLTNRTIDNWTDSRDHFLMQSSEQAHKWHSELMPEAVALWNEMRRRIYGGPPYPEDHMADTALKFGMLSGVAPLHEAALALEQLARDLPE